MLLPTPDVCNPRSQSDRTALCADSGLIEENTCSGARSVLLQTQPALRNRPAHGFRALGLGLWVGGGRGAARAEDAQGTPTQSHISPRTLVYEYDMRLTRFDKHKRAGQQPFHRAIDAQSTAPYGGVRPFHHKSTCLTQLILGPDGHFFSSGTHKIVNIRLD